MADTSKPLHKRILYPLSLAAIASLAALAIIGAFLGAERAAGMFNSPPMASYWVGLTLLMLAGLVYFKALIRRSGLLAMHLGFMLVLIGGLRSSEGGHHVAAQQFGSKRVRRGFMTIPRWRTQRDIHDASGTVLGQTQFDVYLDDLWTEYENPADLIAIPGGDGEPKLIASHPSAETRIPYTDASIRVVDYVSNARPTFENDSRGALIIRRVGQTPLLVPAEVGREKVLEEQGITVRIDRLFEDLQWTVSDEGVTATDRADGIYQPAMLVSIETPGQTVQRILYAGAIIRETSVRGAALRYHFPPPAGAISDPGFHGAAMTVEITHAGRTHRQTLWLDRIWEDSEIDLAALLGPEAIDASVDGELKLVMTRQFTQPAWPAASLAILTDEGVAARADVSPGKPMQFGGYHFYLTDPIEPGERFATFQVGSDAGLTIVYCGFALVALGVFGHFWGGSIHRWWKARRSIAD